ncbi:MAG: glycosyltransferase [Deltaproteobacteria bacterium]|nr:glycosyltransferase [Deltaproteobacteria bacterium]
MRVLVASPFLPYAAVPHAGGKTIYWALEYLSGRHEVDLVSRVFPGERGALDQVRPVVRRLYPVWEAEAATPNAGSLVHRVASYRRLARESARLARQGTYDVVLVEFSELGMVYDPSGGPPPAIDCHDIVTKRYFRSWEQARGPARILRWAAYRAFWAAERRAVRRFPLAFVRSREDARWAERWIGRADVRVIYHPAGAGLVSSGRKEVPGRLVFVGAMDRPFNAAAALFFYREVFPRVRAAFPDSVFRVVGGNPPAELLALAQRDSSLQVTGFVDDLGREYDEASVFVAPILVGGGIIIKVLDALAVGVPVVTTTYGNEGIEAEPGREVFVADTAEAFSAAVEEFLENAALREQMGSRGKRFAEEKFGKEQTLGVLEHGLNELAERSRGRAARL